MVRYRAPATTRMGGVADPQVVLSRAGLRLWAPRLALRTAQALRRAWWFGTRPSTVGARALCLTPANRVVLVRHSYMTGWFLPGGARRHDDHPVAAILRELREEIGLVDWTSVAPVGDIDHRIDFRYDRETVFIVRDVRYRAQLSWEIESIAEFDLDRLPPDLGSGMRERWMMTSVAAKAAPGLHVTSQAKDGH